MKTLPPQEYTDRRNELLALLEDIGRTCPDLARDTREELEKVRNRLLRNCFEIALVGGFQIGKSTTLDALCDGRDISPRGHKIKTSACQISVQSLSEAEPEYAEIAWKTNKELLLSMSDILDSPAAAARFQPQLQDHDVKVLESRQDLDIIRECIRQEWAERLARGVPRNQKERDRLNLLQIASLIISFFEDPKLRSARKQTRVSLDKFSSLVIFPTRWTARWNQVAQNLDPKTVERRIREQFSVTDVQFAFISSVSCRIHCRNLERLGCVVTDSPGLFAGKWDTKVAEAAMRRADAILYLVNGENQIGEADLRKVKEIHTSGQGHKLFMAMNAKTPIDNLKRLREISRNEMKKFGLPLSDDADRDIALFQARLAYNAARMQNGLPLSEELQKSIRGDLLQNGAVSETDDPDEIWKQSGFGALLDRIETLIISRRFRAILIDGGINRAVEAMTQLKSWLESKIQLAQQKKEETARVRQEAENDFAQFRREVEEWIGEEIGDARLFGILQENYQTEVFDRQISEISRIIADRIRDLFGKPATLCDLVRSSKRAEILQPVVGEVLGDVIQRAHSNWMQNVCTDRNETYNYHMYTKKLSPLQKKIRERWDREYQAKNAFLNGLVIQFATPETSTSAEVLSGDPTLSRNLSDYLWHRAGLHAGGIALIVAGLVVAFFLGVGWFVLIAGGLASATVEELAIDKIQKDWDTKFSVRFRQDIERKLRDYFRNEGKENLLEWSKKVINRLLAEQKKIFRTSLDNAKAALDKRLSDSQEMDRKSLEEKQRIAEASRKVHDEQIAPACRRIEHFQSELKQYQ